ncbi:MAG: hypothetical protein K6G30_12105 [Acetatifactor sp.]|nr:hypothetical protein [Acetatifactor sp.]
MKKFFLLIPMMIMAISMSADARSITIPDGCEVVRCTCYLPTGNLTADGTVPYEGICASNREHLGQVAVVYDLDLRIVGFYECRDMGSHEELQNGTRIDIFRETEQGVKEWQQTVGDYVIVQWVEGNG